MTRKDFLWAFLSLLGAEEILWTDETEYSVSGTVFYDLIHLDEKQDFIWHITEEKLPGKELLMIINHLKKNDLIDIDMITMPIGEINIPGLTKQRTIELFDELLKIQVAMVDKGIEVDHYFVHEL